VRTLCEFTAKRGDLDVRFTPTPSAQEGIAGSSPAAAAHAMRRRSACGGEHLAVRGRADGYDPVLAARLSLVRAPGGKRRPSDGAWAEVSGVS